MEFFNFFDIIKDNEILNIKNDYAVKNSIKRILDINPIEIPHGYLDRMDKIKSYLEIN